MRRNDRALARWPRRAHRSASSPSCRRRGLGSSTAECAAAHRKTITSTSSPCTEGRRLLEAARAFRRPGRGLPGSPRPHGQGRLALSGRLRRGGVSIVVAPSLRTGEVVGRLRAETIERLLDGHAAHIDPLQVRRADAVGFRHLRMLSHFWNGAVPRSARGL